jgi:putative colanic acid biosynthesis glycosyltransferase
LKDDEVIVLVGLSEKQLKEVPETVIGISRTNNIEELVDIYSSADIFVNPTLEDNFPTTNLEALACGTPVITFNTGGSSESIDKTCGYVTKVKSTTELYSAIKTIKRGNLNSEDILSRSKLYDKNERYMDYINLYNMLL